MFPAFNNLVSNKRKKMELDKEHIWSLYIEYEKLINTYGPFDYLHPDKIPQTDPSLIWSSAFEGHIINGKSESSAVDWYLVSAKPFESEQFSIDVIEVFLFECPECDDSDNCEFCNEDNMVEIDFDCYQDATSELMRDADSLWRFRKPFGFDYDAD